MAAERMIEIVTMGYEAAAVFLVSAIPSDVALVVGSACGGALVTAIGVLYRRQLVLEDRQQANIERAAASAHATADAINKLTAAIQGSRTDARNS